MKTLLIIAMLGIASTLSAQTIPAITPAVHTTFTASADHNLVIEGTPALTGYQLDVTVMTRPVSSGPLVAGAIVFSIPLGKPTPNASNLIDVPTPTLYTGLTNGIYTTTVAGVGTIPGLKSVVSDPFVRLGPAAAPGKPSIVGQ